MSACFLDLKCQLIESAELLREGVVGFVDIVFGEFMPILAGIGILWWMCPFFPKSDKGAKLTGTSLIIYMFYILIKSSL